MFNILPLEPVIISSTITSARQWELERQSERESRFSDWLMSLNPCRFARILCRYSLPPTFPSSRYPVIPSRERLTAKTSPDFGVFDGILPITCLLWLTYLRQKQTEQTGLSWTTFEYMNHDIWNEMEDEKKKKLSRENLYVLFGLWNHFPSL